MSFLGYVYCAVIGHSSAHMVSLSMLELSVEQPLAVRAIAKALDDHHQGCSCQGRVSTEAVWKADLPWIKELEYMLENLIPRSDQLVDPTSTLQMLYPNNDPPMKSTHLIFGMVPPLQRTWFSSVQLPRWLTEHKSWTSCRALLWRASAGRQYMSRDRPSFRA